jgi:2-carboxy-1,4-naphthoquinone phytyltransferase
MTLKPLNYPTPASPNQKKTKKLWMAAIKPPMYSVAIMPILLGTAVAYADTRSLNWEIFSLFLVSAVLILAWENMSNDVFDSDTGIDRHKAHSLVNLTGNRSMILIIANLLLALGIGGIGAIAYLQQDLTILGIILVCCFLGYLYQGPPFRLGYEGLGEILCFFSFGPLAVAAAYYSQTQAWSNTSLVASVILGISTTLILFCSHFHQVEDDLAAGKRSPIVRLGTAKGSQLLTGATVSIFTLTAIFVALRTLPLGALLIFASLPAAFKLCRHVRAYHSQPARISNSKFIAVTLHFWSSIFLSLGFLF